MPPPPALTPPRAGASTSHLERLFGATPRRTSARPIATSSSGIESAQHWVDVFRSWYGPVHKAFAALPAEGQQRLERDLIALIDEFNASGDATVVIPAEYAEVVVFRK